MNKALEHYECDGQMSIFDLPDRRKELDEKYDIPRKYQKEEGWTDDWHYTELELPKENGIYYCIHYGLNSDFYSYTYMAWAYGHWWAYAGYGEKWLLVRGGSPQVDGAFCMGNCSRSLLSDRSTPSILV